MAPVLAVAGIAVMADRPEIAYFFAALSLVGIPLGLDRYRQLGHSSGNGRLSVRSGSLRRHQVVVEHRAVVGWRLTQTLFQRRVRLATLDVAVGAGHGGYPAIDMAESDAVAFARDITPEWVTPFLSPE
jgi:putative membrane protein